MARVVGLLRGLRASAPPRSCGLVGLFEERYREMRGYSTGMRQRVKLAQALVHDLLVLDSPRTASTRPAGTRCSTSSRASGGSSASRS